MKNMAITKSSKVYRKKRNYPQEYCTLSQRSEESFQKCQYQISLFLWEDLFSILILDTPLFIIVVTHMFHLLKNILGSAEISDKYGFILQQLSVMGVRKSKTTVYWVPWKIMMVHFLSNSEELLGCLWHPEETGNWLGSPNVIRRGFNWFPSDVS